MVIQTTPNPMAAYVYETNSGVKVQVRIHKDRAISGGFTLATGKEGYLPKGFRMRYVNLFKAMPGRDLKEKCLVASLTNPLLTGGVNVTYEGVSGFKVTGMVGEKMTFA